MFGFFKRKKTEEPYALQFAEATEAEKTVEEVEEAKEAKEAKEIGEPDEEPVILEDGRVFSAAFVREIRSYTAEDLKIILEEQGDLYSPEEYAYIGEVFHERLGDL